MESPGVLDPSPADASVRPARGSDTAFLGHVHARAWRAAYSGVLPKSVLAALDADELGRAWDAAVTSPPSRRHGVLVACSGPTVVGFVAVGPSTDADAEAGVDGEIVAMLVDPSHQRAGHGSRLLSAAVARLREDGFGRLSTWIPATDTARREFLVSAGMVVDGGRRTLTVATGEAPAADAPTVEEVRLGAVIGPEES